MEPEGSLLCSQEPITGSYPEPRYSYSNSSFYEDSINMFEGNECPFFSICDEFFVNSRSMLH
jgi:hypothetical protein